MSDSDYNDTLVSFKRITKEMMKILEFKDKLTVTFENFTDHINELNSYIAMYNLHGLPLQPLKRRRIDIDESLHFGHKKKFYTNSICIDKDDNESDDSDNKNNTNRKKKKQCLDCTGKEHII
jgi:hypothetical protein